MKNDYFEELFKTITLRQKSKKRSILKGSQASVAPSGQFNSCVYVISIHYLLSLFELT